MGVLSQGAMAAGTRGYTVRSEAEASGALCPQCGEHMDMALQGLYWLCALLALGTHRHKVAVRPLGTTEAAVGMQTIGHR